MESNGRAAAWGRNARDLIPGGRKCQSGKPVSNEFAAALLNPAEASPSHAGLRSLSIGDGILFL